MRRLIGVMANDHVSNGATGTAAVRENEKEHQMKLSRIVVTSLGVALLAIGAFAAEKGSLDIASAITVQGKTLAPGTYKVEWNGEGPNVQVSISKGKETIVVPATVVPSSSVNAVDAYAEHTLADGSKTLQAIYPHGKKFELDIRETGTAAD